jgi:hypothetical protein
MWHDRPYALFNFSSVDATKNEMSGLIECINVVNFAPDKNSLISFSNIIEAACIDCGECYHLCAYAWCKRHLRFVLANSIKWVSGSFKRLNSYPGAKMICGRLTKVFKHQMNDHLPSGINEADLPAIDENVSTQLVSGGLLRASYELSSGPPQSERREEKQKGKSNQKRIGDFEPVAVERRPELGSLCSLPSSVLLLPFLSAPSDLTSGMLGGGCLGVFGCLALLSWVFNPLSGCCLGSTVESLEAPVTKHTHYKRAEISRGIGVLASLDRRSEDVLILPVIIAELEGESGIIALSTNPRSMSDQAAGFLATEFELCF